MVNKQTAVYIETMPIKNSGYNKELKYSIREVFDNCLSLSILKGLYVPTAKDKLFIFPNCNIPRFKVKSFCESTDTAVVKFKEKANIWFTNKENINTEFIDKLVNNPTDEEKDSNGDLILGSNNRFNFINQEEGIGTVASHEIDHIKNRYSFDLGHVSNGGNHSKKSGIPSTEIEFMKQYRNKNSESISPDRLDPTKTDVYNEENPRQKL
jgi:hypothetical protein